MLSFVTCYSVAVSILNHGSDKNKEFLMIKSETIAKLSAALCAFQSEVIDAPKDKKGHNCNYADLSGVLNIVRPLCAKHGLAFTQLCCSDDKGNVGIETVLMHSESNEYIGSTLMMPLSAGGQRNGAQSAGSVITYSRRYALAAILGITQTDDDASKANSTLKELPKTELITVDTRNAIDAMVDLLNVDAEECTSWLVRAGVGLPSELTQEQGLKITQMLQKRMDAK